MKCKECGKPLYHNVEWGTSSTLVGYMSPPGHDHDDNCVNRIYQCDNGHKVNLSVVNKCPNPRCDWVGRKTCFCHEGEKLEKWPDEA